MHLKASVNQPESAAGPVRTASFPPFSKRFRFVDAHFDNHYTETIPPDCLAQVSASRPAAAAAGGPISVARQAAKAAAQDEECGYHEALPEPRFA